jgi:thioester reductase-like protein
MASFGGSSVFLKRLPPSQEEINFAFEYNKCTIFCAPPIILEQMIPYLKEKNDFTNVRRLKIALFGGAPLKHDSGVWLKEHGLNISNLYGTTEAGACMTSDWDRDNNHWLSVAPYHLDPLGKPYVVFEVSDEATPEVKHVYIRGDSPTMANGVANRADGGYDTNDLFVENSECPGYYTYVCRRDDTLIMKNGEKTNPVPMESTLRQNRMIMQAAIIGQDRQCTAALIELDTKYAMSYSPDEIISEVQAAVKEANKECPNHSKIIPQMFKILPFDKTLPSTDKGTVMRKKSETMYKDYVEKLYKNLLDGSSKRDSLNANKDSSSTWTAEQIESFLIGCAADVLDLPRSSFVDRNQCLFDLGLDSLSAIQLRNCIAECFDDVPQNLLFQNPNILSLCESILGGKEKSSGEIIKKRYHEAQSFAQSYIKKARFDFPMAENRYDENEDKIVLLTGASGSLGSFLLQDLLKDSSIKKVYCLVRGKQEQLNKRLYDAFKSRSLDESLLETDRLETLPLRLGEPFMGLAEEKYNQLKEEVTIIQHCAWLLDFNMPIDHFDKECIAPFYNLLKFAYKNVNPMHVHFISSVSASAAWKSEIPEKPLPFDSHTCMPMGYAHSKFVVEQILNYLTTEKHFPCYIERLGQVCGDSLNGVWNTSEQYPLMFIGGASVMHKMPDLSTQVDWITVDYASASIVEIMLRTAYLPADKNEYIYHIVNPHTIHWTDVLQAMKDAGMNFDVVSPAEWVEELSKDNSNPAYRLLAFFTDNFKAEFKMPLWITKNTTAMAPILAKSPTLSSSLFSKFLKRWETVGFYNSRI